MKKPIPHSRPWITAADHAAVKAVLKSEMIAKGEMVRRFEAKINQYIGGVGAVATSSGTAALVLALRALGITAGDEVILPDYTCKSVANAILTVGATPRVCDIGEQWLMTPETVASVFSNKTKAIILVHTYGIALPVSDFKTFGVPLVEDCCQSLGLKINQQMTGSLGDIGVFSFHATKCLTTGEGGMCVSKNPEILESMRHLQTVARDRVLSPLTDLQAALGLSQFARYSEMLKRRRRIAKRYFEELDAKTFALPLSIRQQSMFFRFPIRVDMNFEKIQKRFIQDGISLRKGVDELVSEPPHLTNAKETLRTTISLPCYPALTDREQSRVIKACGKLLRGQVI